MNTVSPWRQVTTRPSNPSALFARTLASDQNKVADTALTPGLDQFNGVNGFTSSANLASTENNDTAVGGGSASSFPVGVPPSWLDVTPAPIFSSAITASAEGSSTGGAQQTLDQLNTDVGPLVTSPFPSDTRGSNNLTGVSELDDLLRQVDINSLYIRSPFSTKDMPNYLDVAKAIPQATEEINFVTLVEAANKTKDMGNDTEAVKKWVADALAKASR